MTVKLAQLKVSPNISLNVEKIKKILTTAKSGEWILFPEGMISGYYPEDDDFLKKLDNTEIEKAIGEIEDLVFTKKANCLIGTALKIKDQWFNTTIILSNGQRKIYRKNNLSILDRQHFSAGSEIKVMSDDSFLFGVAMCRELIFPEQWRLLKKKKAQVIFHINNAIRPIDKLRENVLITRALENQYWVCSVNNATAPQTMKSMVINPQGEIVWASTPQKEELGEVNIDLKLRGE